jgi:hypothetical protein
MKHSVNPTLIKHLVSKASQSLSCYRLSGVAISKKGEILGFARNGFRRDNIPSGKYSGKHVEQALIERYGTNIKSIIIMRIGNGGDILPIHPCPKCAKLAEKYGIKIYPVR